MKASFVLILTSLLLMGCSSHGVKTAPIVDALSTHQGVLSTVEYCTTVNAEQTLLYQRAAQSWWQQNAQLVHAADWGLVELNWYGASERAIEDRTLIGLALLENIQQKGDKASRQWLGRRMAPKDCEDWATQVLRGRYDLKSDKSLVALGEQRRSVTENVEAAKAINTRYRQYGRSLFIVEQTLRASGCSSNNVALLRNAWPVEVYDATCEQNYVLVQCEWGRCEVKR